MDGSCENTPRRRPIWYKTNKTRPYNGELTHCNKRINANGSFRGPKSRENPEASTFWWEIKESYRVRKEPSQISSSHTHFSTGNKVSDRSLFLSVTWATASIVAPETQTVSLRTCVRQSRLIPGSSLSTLLGLVKLFSNFSK